MTRISPAAALVLVSCSKVPIYDVEAFFTLADAAWFEEEETLFLFTEVHAEQGLGEPSVIEVTYITDTERVPWTPIDELPSVHTHLPVDCGVDAMCGSNSVHVSDRPRDVRIRLRFHRDGELALEARSTYNAVDAGAAHSHRSFVVYGVFDEANERMQWRGRHQFPTLRNQRAEELGLRRTFTIRDPRYGRGENVVSKTNPYGYGVDCPARFEPTGLGELTTDERAAFYPEKLPLEAFTASLVCAQATVEDATGTFTTGAIAQKNPEVRPAFPVLRSPIRDARPVPFFLGPCERVISEEHEDMQRQRLHIANVPTTCTDDWETPGFFDDLVVRFTDAVERARPEGEDMVLVVALHRDEPGLAELLEEALARVVPAERHRSTPRLAGAFVLDSDIRSLQRLDLEPVTLWCPADLPLSELPDASSRTCAIAPDNPDLVIGPFSFGALPVLPSRAQYLDFIDTYSDAQAGRVEEIHYRVPEFAATSDHIDLGPYGTVTFLNEEVITADANDAFSFCADEESLLFQFRSNFMQSDLIDYVGYIDPYYCYLVGIPASICTAAAAGVAPVEVLPDWHELFGERTYELGIYWDFPFLLRMDYRLVGAGSISAFGLSVPFGIGSPAEAYYGTFIWTQDEFFLEDALTQCERFCDHPTFDSAGVYHVTDPFRTTYLHNCYLPVFPELGDSGFPLDP